MTKSKTLTVLDQPTTKSSDRPAKRKRRSLRSFCTWHRLKHVLVWLSFGGFTVSGWNVTSLRRETNFFLVAWLVVTALFFVPERRFARSAHKPLLDQQIVALSPTDNLTVRDLQANVLIIGRTGSSKTTGSGRTIFRGCVAHPKSSGLALGSKPEDARDFERLLRQAGRHEDYLVFSATGPLKFNVLDHVFRTTGGSTREIVSCLTTLGESLKNAGRRRSGDESAIWEKLSEEMLYHVVQLVKIATGGVTAHDLQRFLVQAAESPEQFASEQWRKGFHYQVLVAAQARPKSAADTWDCEEAITYFLKWPHLEPRIRSSILIGVKPLLFTFCSGQVHELIASESTFDLGDVLRDKWLIVDMPPSTYGDAGQLVGAAFKYLVQKDILRREVTPDDGFTVIWLDEFQQWVTSFDARQFLPTCRSHQGCMVALTQSLHGLHAALGGEQGDHEVKSLLANFHHRIFHALGSFEDAEFASNLCGRKLTRMLGVSNPPARSISDELFGPSKLTTSFSSQYEAVIQPREFLNGLRCGGPANRFMTDVVIVRTGEPFANGQNFLRTSFRQS